MYLLRTSITFLHSKAKFLVSYLVTCLHKTWLLIEVQKYCQDWYNCNAATARFKYCGCKKFFYGFEQSPSIDPMKHIMCWHSHNQSNDINTLCLAILHVHSGDALSLSFCSLKEWLQSQPITINCVLVFLFFAIESTFIISSTLLSWNCHYIYTSAGIIKWMKKSSRFSFIFFFAE